MSNLELGIGESGSVSVEQTNRDQWHTVNLKQQYNNPIVVMGPATYNGTHPLTIRVNDVKADSFKFKIDEWHYLDGPHAQETIGYLVLEAGVHDLGGGFKIAAGSFEGKHEWQSISFGTSFPDSPVVISQCATYKGGDPVVTRHKDVTGSSFAIRLQEEEKKDNVHAVETIMWIAVQQTGSRADLPFVSALTSQSVTNSWYNLSWNLSNPTSPILLAAIQTFAGTDTASLRCKNIAASGCSIFVEEEASKDNEISHAEEKIGYIVFGSSVFLKVEKDEATSSSLVAYYPFNGNANDESGNNHHGTVSGATLTADRFGRANSAYDFNGVNNYIDVVLNELRVPAWTVSLWANTDTINNSAPFYLMTNTSGGQGDGFWWHFFASGGVYYRTEDLEHGERDIDKVAVSLKTGIWEHHVIVATQNTIKHYIDGNNVYTCNTEFNPENLNSDDLILRIGESYNNGDYFYDGKVDDVRVYNRALTEAEIKELHQSENEEPSSIAIQKARFKVLHGGSVCFTKKNPVLLEGEWAYETDTGKLKIGDGITKWSDLEYTIDKQFTEEYQKLIEEIKIFINKGDKPGGYPVLDQDGKIPLDKLPSNLNVIRVVGTIADRDAIDAYKRYEGLMVMVIDASADSTVNKGGATYILKVGLSNSDWEKISEAESLDIDPANTDFFIISKHTLDNIKESETRLHFTKEDKDKLDSIKNIFTDAEKVKLAGIEDGADKTDYTKCQGSGFGTNKIVVFGCSCEDL